MSTQKKRRYTYGMNRAYAIVVMLFLMPSFASAARLYIEPATMTYGYGDTFVATIRLDNQDECVNAVHVALSYPTDTLRAVDFSRGNSILSLWIEEPRLDTDLGTVVFSGGIPGGYCGRIQGDASLSNMIGKVVFSVVDAQKEEAKITFSNASRVYLNDGLGTSASLETFDADVRILPEPVNTENPWLEEVGKDEIPPDEFPIIVESTDDVFGGKYYVVFSTVDKQSGLDHFEIFERGVWKKVQSPHELWDQSLRGGIQVKAIDKAGNERLGTYVEGSAPPRKAPAYGFLSLIGLVIVLLLVVGLKLILDRHRAPTEPVLPS